MHVRRVAFSTGAVGCVQSKGEVAMKMIIEAEAFATMK